MGKFFYNIDDQVGNTVTIKGYSAHHMLNVLRLRIGEEVVLCNGLGIDYSARLASIPDRASVVFEISSPSSAIPEPNVPITLYQGIPKGDKMDWVIEKCIEVGVHKIVPVSTSRSVVKIKDAGKKAERYARIAEAAASQCMRGLVPEIAKPLTFAEALEHCCNKPLCLIAHEKEQSTTIKSALLKLSPQPISLWIGPEGGFDENEVTAITNKTAAFTISLGPRILRTETAGIVALSQILCLWGGER